MKMQRISENIYIDDTLVTCAEYQLFIDERLEQGTSYQPDHWNSYRFSAGHGHDPILGIRQADAIAFCEWLKLRDTGDWSYRLPTNQEAIEYPIYGFNQQHKGYWLKDIHTQPQFFWMDRSILDARKLNFANFLRFAHSVGFSHQHEIHSFLEQIRSELALHPLDLDQVHKLAIDITSELQETQTFVLNQNVRSGPKSRIELALSIPRYQDLGRNLEYDAFQILEMSRKLKNCRESNATRAIYFDFALACVCFIDLREAGVRNSSSVLMLLGESITLNERIHGHSPAFEGIRLVKERLG